MKIFVLVENCFEYGEMTTNVVHWTSNEDVAKAWASKPDLIDSTYTTEFDYQEIEELK
ncbi:hypothetical protein [Vibrio phage vB_VpaP_SJSY21]|nr:hypothetical protein [Vibrio phage vB_VpaP_SJSY21]